MKLEQMHVDHSREAGDFIGEDMERAYGEVLREFGRVQGGVGDHGLDFVSLDRSVLPNFQIKTSWQGAEKFLAKSLAKGVFIPIAIGEPGSAEEMASSFKQFGGWVEKDEPLRESYLLKIQKIKTFLQGIPRPR
jgi:hypothetical protein